MSLAPPGASSPDRPAAAGSGEVPRRGLTRETRGCTSNGRRPTFKGRVDEQRTSAGGHAQGRVRPDVGRTRGRTGTSSGPHFAGWEIYHLKGSPADPEPALRVADAAAGSARSSSAPTTAARPGSRSATSSSTTACPGTHQWYDGTPHPWEFKRVWHLEPSLTDPDTVYAGVEDAALFRTDRRRADLARAARAARARLGRAAGSRARAGCACTRSCSTRRTRSGCSSRSPRPARSAPTTAARRGSRSTAGCGREGIPDPDAEVGHCVHRIAMHPSRPGRALHAEALGRHAQRRRRRLVARGQRQPADRLRLPDRRARARAGDDLRRADQERLRALPARRQAARLSQPHRRQRVGGADQRAAAAATAT